MARLRNKSAVISMLRKQADVILLKFSNGVVKAGLYLQQQSMKLVPVDYGNLKASAFTRATGKGTDHVVVTVGYTAAYAVYVHEDLEKAHGAVFNQKYAAELAEARRLIKKGVRVTGPFRHSRGPYQQAKFLESPFRQGQSSGDFKAIIAGEMLS